MTKIETIIARAKAGDPYAEIARSLGVSRQYVNYVAIPHVGRRQRSAVRLDSIDQRRVVAAYQDAGQSTIEIAAEFGCCHSAISKYLRRAGVKLRTRTNPTRLRNAVLRRVKNGQTYSEVAAALGITRNKVAGLVHRHRDTSAT